MQAPPTEAAAVILFRRPERSFSMHTFVTAVALMLVFEGLLPFISPASWRSLVRRIGVMTDGQIRFFGMTSMLAGLVLLLFLLG